MDFIEFCEDCLYPIFQFSWNVRHNGLGYAISQVLLGIFLLIIIVITIIVIFLAVIYCIHSLICEIVITVRTKQTKYFKVFGIVTKKEASAAFYVLSKIGDIYSPIFFPAKYEVYIKYKNIVSCFDDPALFFKVEKGDRISLILVKRYDKKGKIIKKSLELPEK